MTRTNYITINGVTFERSVNFGLEYDMIKLKNDWNYSSIWDAYNKPSYTKECIWCDWKTYFQQLGADEIVVDSRNCYKFTIKSKFQAIDSDGVLHSYIATITDLHNRLLEISC